MKHIRPLDYLLIPLILIISLLPLFREREVASYAEVRCDSGIYRYALDNNTTVSFSGPEGETVVEIKNKSVSIISSDCPNQTCLQGRISLSGEMLVCLPNHVTITVRGEGGVDAVAF